MKLTQLLLLLPVTETGHRDICDNIRLGGKPSKTRTCPVRAGIVGDVQCLCCPLNKHGDLPGELRIEAH